MNSESLFNHYYSKKEHDNTLRSIIVNCLDNGKYTISCGETMKMISITIPNDDVNISDYTNKYGVVETGLEDKFPDCSIIFDYWSNNDYYTIIISQIKKV